jgi:3-dehydrosphinganine reductase
MPCPFALCGQLFSCTWTAAAAWGSILFAVATYALKHKVPLFTFPERVVIITGGSEGMGLEMAKQLVSRGCHVYIAARRQELLNKALEELETIAKSDGFYGIRRYGALKVDVSDEASIAKEFQKVLATHGRVDLLICNAGFSYPARFLEISPEKAKQMMDVNFWGCVNSVRAVLPKMHEQKFGRVLLVSSMAATASVAGFSIYGPTKSALRAFAQAMDMENATLGVRFQCLNPPDVATPGFEEENKSKSTECKKICAFGGASPFSAKEVALAAIRGIESYSFNISVGFDGFLLGVLASAMEPPTSALHLLFETLFGGLLRFVICVYVKFYYRIVDQVRRDEARGGGAGKR